MKSGRKDRWTEKENIQRVQYTQKISKRQMDRDGQRKRIYKECNTHKNK